MGKIVAIGGGEISAGETDRLNQYIVSLTGKAKPRLLFIPTASHDASGYVEVVRDRFGALGCDVEALCLYTQAYGEGEIESLILGADIVYVGGGDTVRMMEKWAETGVYAALKEAYRRGVVLSGLSAGSICWFVFGHSDSESFVNQGQWDYVRAYGLGLIPAAHCPHYNEEGRESFDAVMADERLPGIALENGAALVEIDGEYRIVKENGSAKAFLLKNHGGVLHKEEMEEGRHYDLR